MAERAAVREFHIQAYRASRRSRGQERQDTEHHDPSEVQAGPAVPFPPAAFGLPKHPVPGVTIRWLDTSAALQEEGRRMGHCVGSLCYAARAGDSVFYHVEVGAVAATVQLERNGRLIQVSGPRNQHNAACTWVRTHLTGLLHRR